MPHLDKFKCSLTMQRILRTASIAVVCLLLAHNTAHCAEEELPSSIVVSQWAKQVGTKLNENFMSSSEYDVLQNNYLGDIHQSAKFVEVNAEEELAKMATKITEIFTRRIQALKDIVTKAEELTITYSYDPKLELDDVPLFKMADYNVSSPELSLVPQFGREVTTNNSGVHTPLEVYEGYKDVLNGLVWSAGVDSVFKANLARDPDMSWQYLGSHLGFLRLYPATWWQPPEALDNVDLYDVRRRPWYIEGSVSPKDVIILMDISGSVHGQTFEIMKVAVKTVLNTLGENDYVNIAWSTNRVGWANPCMDSLVPATMVNKRALFAAVDALEARNTSDLALGLEFAFKAFENFYNGSLPDYVGTDCHKLIMFFSDGGTEWPGNVIETYKNKTLTKDVRLFSYALGPHPVPSQIMRRMACENGGFFSVIVATGAIRNSIQESFVGVLGKPLALSNTHPKAESSPYLDAGGLGYVTTLSMPVFNRSHASDGQSLLGVAGVDITMAEIHRLSPWKKLGPFGYTFAINPNGIVMFHPRLKEPRHYLEDPPDLDLTHLEEGSQGIRDIRTQMIRRNAATQTMEQTVTLPDGHQVDLGQVKVTYRPLDNTTLSLGMVVRPRRTHMVVTGQTESAGLPACAACLLPPSWDYCPDLTADGADRWHQLSDRLQAGGDGCTSELVQHLLWDVGWTANVARNWKASQPAGVLARFIVTDGGLTRFHPADSGDQMSDVSEPYRSGLYRQAALTDSLVVRPRSDAARLVAAKRVVVAKSTGDIYPLAVVGVHYNATWLWRVVDGVVASNTSAGPVCSEEAGVRCWLLDTAGTVVYSSEPRSKALGRHLGLEDPQLMEALIAAGVFRNSTVYDYQAICSKDKPGASAGSILRDPLSWLNTQLLLDSATGLLRWLDYLRYLVASAVLSAQSAPIAALDEFGFEINSQNHSCTQRIQRTQLTKAPQPYQGAVLCSDPDCSRTMFRASLVTDTNLVLVVADVPCTCSQQTDEAPAYQPREDIGPDRCEEDQTPLFRKRPPTCYATNENETPACSGAGGLTSSALLLLVAAAAGLHRGAIS